MRRQFVPEENRFRLSDVDFQIAGFNIRRYIEKKYRNDESEREAHKKLPFEHVPLLGIGGSGYKEAGDLMAGASEYLVFAGPFLINQDDRDRRKSRVEDKRGATRAIDESPVVVVYENRIGSGESLFGGLLALKDFDLIEKHVIVVAGKDFFERDDLKNEEGKVKGRAANYALRTTEGREFYGPRNAMERILEREEQKRREVEALQAYPIKETLDALKKYGIWGRLVEDDIPYSEPAVAGSPAAIDDPEEETAYFPAKEIAAGFVGLLLRRWTV